MQQTFQTIGMAVGVFLATVLVVVGGTVLRQYRNPGMVDLLPRSVVSDEDRKVLQDPEAANKAAYEKMCREAWERSQAQQPQNGWDRGWKK